MFVLPRAQGEPSDRAAEIIQLIRDYAAAEPSETHEENAQRVRDLHHLVNAATDSLYAGMARVNAAEHAGKVSVREMAPAMGLSGSWVWRHIKVGQELLEGAA